MYGHFKRQINEISHDKRWTWLRKKTLRKKLNLLLISYSLSTSSPGNKKKMIFHQ